MYSVIINYEKKNNLVWVITLDKKLNPVHEPLMLSVGDIGSYLTRYNAQPYNYSVDSNYKIIQDNGNFDRFSALGSIVVIATYKSSNRTMDWYLVLDCKSATLLQLSKAQIIDNAKKYGREYYTQNAIISGTTIKPFPKKQFFEINIPSKQKQEVDYDKILNGSLDYNDKKKNNVYIYDEFSDKEYEKIVDTLYKIYTDLLKNYKLGKDLYHIKNEEPEVYNKLYNLFTWVAHLRKIGHIKMFNNRILKSRNKLHRIILVQMITIRLDSDYSVVCRGSLGFL